MEKPETTEEQIGEIWETVTGLTNHVGDLGNRQKSIMWQLNFHSMMHKIEIGGIIGGLLAAIGILMALIW